MTGSELSALPPGSTIGILGGGQLGRMLSLAAARLGLRTHIFTPEAGSPASQVSDQTTVAEYTDLKAITDFAKSVDVVTYEFENVPSKTAISAAVAAPIFPPIEALDVAQDRLTEKTFISNTAGVPVAPFYEVNNEFDASRALKVLGGKCVLKTRRLGYDGKGQQIISSEDMCAPAFKALGGVPCIAEQFIPFVREVSVVGARSPSGQYSAYPLIENEHRNHILYQSVCPAANDSGQAQSYAQSIAETLDYVGVLAVEFFELEDGSLLVNEIAPRVHNSGHFSMDAGCTDQFELHIRAIAGWPLGNTMPTHVTEMTNLLGEDMTDWETLAGDPDTRLHIYGKADARPGRKMAHINRRKS